VITLEFPVEESTARYTVNAHSDKEQTYTCRFRGSTLVDISPRDETPTSYPLYQRSYLSSDGTLKRKSPVSHPIAWSRTGSLLGEYAEETDR